MGRLGRCMKESGYKSSSDDFMDAWPIASFPISLQDRRTAPIGGTPAVGGERARRRRLDGMHRIYTKKRKKKRKQS